MIWDMSLPTITMYQWQIYEPAEHYVRLLMFLRLVWFLFPPKLTLECHWIFGINIKINHIMNKNRGSFQNGTPKLALQQSNGNESQYYILFYLLDNILLDLELNFIGKLLVFRWELTVLLLLQICLFFVMREISWSLSHVKIRLTLLRLSIQLQVPWRFIKYWRYLLWPNGGPDIPYRTQIK